MHSNIFSRISFLSLLLTTILLPVFFLPFTNISIETSKSLLLVAGLIASVIFWIIARFSDGKINLPRSVSLLAGGGIVLVFFLSALFSGASGASFFGVLLDIGTFWFIFSAFLLMLMSAVIFPGAEKARIVLFGTTLSAAVLLFFQTWRLFLPKILSLGVLTEKTGNLLGSWNALGIFAGFFIIASLLLIEFFSLKKSIKLMLGILIALSLFLIAAVNFFFIWGLLGIFALLIFIFKISANYNQTRDNEQKPQIHFPAFSFVIILVAILFFTSTSFIGGILPNKLGIRNAEVSPSFLSTMSVTKSVIKARPILGTGPNRFSEAWALYKPAVVNATLFWDTSFGAGSGLLPTLTATTGVLGILAWLAFFILFITSGIKSIFFSIKNNANFELVSFFLLSLYLFVASFFYFTGAVVFLLSMVFAGVFVGLVASLRPKGEMSFSFLDDHRKSFFFMLLLVLLIIASIVVGFKYIQRFASVPFFTRTLLAGNVKDAEISIGKALTLNTNDLYLRTYAQIYLLELNSTASKDPSSLSDTDKAGLQVSLDQAVNGAQLAINYNPKNYLNFVMLGTVFQTAGLIGVKDAYPRALEAYQRAGELNPNNPRIKLLLSNVSGAMGNTKDAKDYANQALTLKPDYIEALLALSQIARSEGNNAQAISYAERALTLAPANQDLIKYVNSLRSSSGENL